MGMPGIHHVTAIAGDPQRNLDFYTGVLGLRLVKVTVNFDDPETYHLYFGDGEGTPGSILTFFPWAGVRSGRRGTGQATVTAFTVPHGSIGYWLERLKDCNVVTEPPQTRFGDEVLAFNDPDGLRLELVAGDDHRQPWTGGRVPPEHAIRGFHGVTLSEEGHNGTERLLTETLGFRAVGHAGSRFRYDGGQPGGIVDVECVPDLAPGRMGLGVVHHVAFRASNRPMQDALRGKVVESGLNVTPVIDRKYFQSIYFREPGGVLFEIATDAPGFAVDEPVSELGSSLCLPAALEAKREYIEARLRPLKLPARAGSGGRTAA